MLQLPSLGAPGTQWGAPSRHFTLQLSILTLKYEQRLYQIIEQIILTIPGWSYFYTFFENIYVKAKFENRRFFENRRSGFWEWPK